MALDTLLALALALALYVEAGRRTLQVLTLTHRGDNEVYQAVKEDRVPRAAMIAWLICWAPIMFIGWARTHLPAPNRLRTFP